MARQPRESQEGTERERRGRACFGSRAGGHPERCSSSRGWGGSPSARPRLTGDGASAGPDPRGLGGFTSIARAERLNAVPQIAGDPNTSPCPPPALPDRQHDQAEGWKRILGGGHRLTGCRDGLQEEPRGF